MSTHTESLPTRGDETPIGPPADLVALFPNVSSERWEYVPPRPGCSGQWKVTTGAADAVPLAETLRRLHSPERMTLKEAIRISLEGAKRAREGTGPVFAGRPHPKLAERYERQGRELRALGAIAARRRRHRAAALPSSRRRTPVPRPSARRPAARRALGSRVGQDPGDDGEPERPPSSGEPPARVLVRGKDGVFVADACEIECGVVTASGRWQWRWGPNYSRSRFGPQVARSWPAHRCEVRWASNHGEVSR